MNETHIQVFEKSRFVFQEKSDHFQYLALSDHEVCKAITYSRNIAVEQSSTDRKLLVEAMMEGIEKPRRLFRKASSLFIKTYLSSVFFDSFPVSSFHSKESNTKIDFWVAKCTSKNVDWDIDWRNVAGKFDNIYDWVVRKINPVSSFWLNLFVAVPLEESISTRVLLKEVLHVGDCWLRQWRKGWSR